MTAFKLSVNVTIRVNIFTNRMIPLFANIAFDPIVIVNLQMSWWCFLITATDSSSLMLSPDESLDKNTSSSNTKFFFPFRLGLLLLYSGMLMVMFVRALNVEAGSSIFVFKDAISGTVLGG